jgi:hypothetical protein
MYMVMSFLNQNKNTRNANFDILRLEERFGLKAESQQFLDILEKKPLEYVNRNLTKTVTLGAFKISMLNIRQVLCALLTFHL